MKWSRRLVLCFFLCGLVAPWLSFARRSDPAILRVQESLQQRGYETGPVDGVLGKQTKRAIKAFQHDQQLPETGIVDAKTRAALQNSQTGTVTPAEKPSIETAPSTTVSSPEPQMPEIARVPLVYTPPRVGAPKNRVGAAVRGKGERLILYALDPADHIGQTIQEQPVLYWYLEELTAHRIELTIVDVNKIDPVFEGALSPPTHVGIQQIRLADYGVHLSLGVHYVWSVSIIPDPTHHLQDLITSGDIQRVEQPQPLEVKLSQATKEQRPALYAEAGLWYEALSSISDLIDAIPNDSSLRAQRASLLEQGMHEVAEGSGKKPEE